MTAFDTYFSQLREISFAGRVYKKFYASPILYACARRFGARVLEVGCGIGSGVLGAFPGKVQGIDVNPHAIEYCRAKGLNARLITAQQSFPIADGTFDCCVLDNVLEHIADPQHTLAECHRVTANNGGLVIAVPGARGYALDPDHKQFYGREKLAQLNEGWRLQRMLSLPFAMISERLSKSVRQYCLVAVYGKISGN
jgi:SAM-dependent methyltransferase